MPGDDVLRAFYHRRKVFVLGADGFLGVNCIYALQELGAEVSILTRRPSPRAVGFSGRVIRGDLRDVAQDSSVLEGQTIVFDFAGVSGAAESNRNPLRDLEENCGAQLSILQACAKLQPSPLVMFCSSRLVYGKPQYLPVDEAHPIAPQSFYAAHKVTVENYLRVLWQTRGLRYCVVRLSNPYGPNQPADARSYGVINQFIRTAVEGGPIRIFGNGQQLRDYIFVDDVISAFLLCAMNQQCHGQIFNLGGRSPIRFKDAAQCIAMLAGHTPLCLEPWPERYKSVETGDYYTDLKKFDSVVSLAPPLSFEEGILRTLGYYRDLHRAAPRASASARPGS